ncbi:MAG: PepSY domain-containing protein [Firmicutes bacterium]|nr:PepSY domain-containing protein [Bacillota bacterium]
MKKSSKYLVLSIAIIIMLCTAFPVMANVFKEQITVSKGINVYLDGVKLNPIDAYGNPVEVFAYADISVAYQKISITATEAFDIYMERYPNTQVKEIELDSRNNVFVYKVEGFDESKVYKVYIDADTGNILNTEEKLSRDRHRGFSKDNLNKVEELVNMAIAAEGIGARLDDWEIEIENGVLVLEIEIDKIVGRDVKYKYNLETGELILKD